MDHETQRLVESGKGYWCYYVTDIEPVGPEIVESGDESLGEMPSFNEQLVYQPVNVDINEDGEPYAWFPDPDLSLLDTDGNRYVRIEEVRLTPPPDAEPAYKYE